MSAYVVDNKTISAIVKGFEIYGVEYLADNYEVPVQVIINLSEIREGIGQSLLDQNYKSVNYRYDENTQTPKFEYEDVEVNAGTIYGCIQCYNYQACETEDYFESVLYNSLIRLEKAMLERYIEKDGFEIPWGYEE